MIVQQFWQQRNLDDGRSLKIPKIDISPAMVPLNRDDLIKASGHFDANWYASRYGDVGLLGMSPCDHFLKIGEKLGRSPGPDFDTKFYLESYSVWHPSGSALADYLTARDIYPRPTTRAALAGQMTGVSARTADHWGPVGDRKISYCIPVMNRFGDIEGTLARNLKANEAYRNEIEFLVIEFGDQQEVSEWIAREPAFAPALQDGYLRVVTDRDTLDIWHFGRAKNAFRALMRGQIYSSLDADNFVTAEETAWLMRVADKHPLGFIAHHFDGDFNDGTCGRVSMPAPLYRSVGYDPDMFPRNWDEIDLMVGAMTHFPAAPLVLAGPEPHIMSFDFGLRRSVMSEKLANRIIVYDYPERILPLNPTPYNLMVEKPIFKHYDTYNKALSGLRLTKSTARETTHMKNAQAAGRRIIDTLPAQELVEILFEPVDWAGHAASDRLCLFASVRDEADFLPGFVAHYRALGVERFYFVDDRSATPVSALELGSDVFAVRPRVGNFRTSKALWLGALANLVVPENAWMLTVDVDELVQVPKPFTGFRDLIADLDHQGVELVPGLLMDMLPHDPAAYSGDRDDPFAAFDSFCWMPLPVDQKYRKTGTVKWGFEEHTEISWRVDARYHAFGTIDSLRKIPLLRRRSGWHLNEGFHTLFPSEGRVVQEPSPKLFDQSTILPVFHYKLSRLWTEEARQRMVTLVDHYDPPTKKNILSYFKPDGGVERLATLKAHLRPKEDALSGDLFSTVLRAENSHSALHKKNPQTDERPFIILTLQRTGSTNFAQAMKELSRFPSAKDHEPFLARRQYGQLLRDWNKYKDANSLDQNMSDVLSELINIKHCFEVVPPAINDALISAAERNGYRFLFLYRKDFASRILSAEFARRTRIWGPKSERDTGRMQAALAKPLDVEALLNAEARYIKQANALWARVNKTADTAVAIAFEDIYKSNENSALSSVRCVVNALKLTEGHSGLGSFVERLRSRGNQGTRERYTEFSGYQELTEAAKALPRFSFESSEIEMRV